jgi:hypothetical protein
VRIVPYRTQENVIQGAVITFIDGGTVRQPATKPRQAEPPAAAAR